MVDATQEISADMMMMAHFFAVRNAVSFQNKWFRGYKAVQRYFYVVIFVAVMRWSSGITDEGMSQLCLGETV